MKYLLALILLVVLVGCAVATPTEVAYEPMRFITPKKTVEPENTPTQASFSTLATEPALELINFEAISTAIPNPFPNQNPYLCRNVDCILDLSLPLQRPIGLTDRHWIDVGYPYGSTAGNKYAPHHGVEFYNPAGTLVLAAADGLVIVAGTDYDESYSDALAFYGNLVIIEHDIEGFGVPIYTLYGHLLDISVSVGDSVSAGDQVGTVGMTGWAIGPHLHFEVRLGENSYFKTDNPALWLSQRISQDGQAFGSLTGLVIRQSGVVEIAKSLTLEALDKNGEVNGKKYFFRTYEDPQLYVNALLHENFVHADLPAGDYRLTVVAGKLFERVVSIEPGKITYVFLIIP